MPCAKLNLKSTTQVQQFFLPYCNSCACLAVDGFRQHYSCYVCMHGRHIHSKSKINRVRLSILLVASWSGKMNISLSPFATEYLVSRDGFGSPVPRQPAHLYTQAESGAYLRNSSRVARRRPFIYLKRHTPSGQSRVYRVTQLRTDGVHCRESAGTGPVNLKVVPNGCCLGRSPWTKINMRLSLPHPIIGMKWGC